MYLYEVVKLINNNSEDGLIEHFWKVSNGNARFD